MSRTRWNYRYFIRSVVVIMCVVFCVGCQKKSQETDLKTVSVREEEPESTPEDSREDTKEDVGKVKEEDTAKKKDDAVPDTEDRPEKLYVHVCGNVNQPGVYELQQDSRVFEAIEAAGGMTTTAAFSYLNQAELLKDGQQIYVPSQEEVDSGKVTSTRNASESDETFSVQAVENVSGQDDGKARRASVGGRRTCRAVSLFSVRAFLRKGRAVAAYPPQNADCLGAGHEKRPVVMTGLRLGRERVPPSADSGGESRACGRPSAREEERARTSSLRPC